MTLEAIHDAVRLGEKMGHVYLATADRRGMPHLAAAGRVGVAADNRVFVEAWFCPGTVKNIQENALVSVVSWNPETDTGYQILGKVENVAETAMLNGFSPQIESDARLPQSLKRLTIRVGEVLAFSHAPHNDEPE